MQEAGKFIKNTGFLVDSKASAWVFWRFPGRYCHIDRSIVGESHQGLREWSWGQAGSLRGSHILYNSYSTLPISSRSSKKQGMLSPHHHSSLSSLPQTQCVFNILFLTRLLPSLLEYEVNSFLLSSRVMFITQALLLPLSLLQEPSPTDEFHL